MTRDEIALRLIETALARPDMTVRLDNPWPKWWTTNPPPAFYTMIENALFVADKLLMPPKEVEAVAR